MANPGRLNSNSSQFFITSKPQPSMDNKYVVFGRVTKGMDVVHRVESCATSAKGEMNTEVKNRMDELVAFAPTRCAYIQDCGEFETEDISLALEDGTGGPPRKKLRVDAEVNLYHLLKKHSGCRDPKTCRGVVATCTKGKAKVQVANLRKRVEAAASAVREFADLAREHSDSSSASSGGDLGAVAKGDLEAELEDAAFSLGPGQLSEIIETHEGIHIFLRAPS
jgi:hypothetical protein